MKCNQCGAHMRLDKKECSGNSCTYWYECQVCRKVRLTSSRVDAKQLASGPTVRPQKHATNLQATAATRTNQHLLSGAYNDFPAINLGISNVPTQPARPIPAREHAENQYELALERAYHSDQAEA